MDLEHAPTSDLIDELFSRETFVGVLVHVTREVRGAKPTEGQMDIRRSSKLSLRESVWTLGKANAILLDAMITQQTT
jgi:hypothetical protein